MADTSGKRASFEDVRKEELKAIAERRAAVKPDKGQPGEPGDLTGLALSGGGLRSAFFAMGFVQALHRSGLWKHIDYISSVSGGGYLAGYLTSEALKHKKPFSKDDFPLGNQGDLKQAERVRRFIRDGKTFVRPIALFNRYLIGLFCVNMYFFSGLLGLAALVAFIWRCWDYPEMREQLELLDLDSDFIAPFCFFACFALAWLVAWGISYSRRGSEASTHLPHAMLIGVVASLLIGVALLMGNGDIAMGALGRDSTWSVSEKIWMPIVGVILGGLLPLLHPRRLLRSGADRGAPWESYFFSFVKICVLFGVPLLLVGVLARENISGFNTHRYRDPTRGDIADWDALCNMLVGPAGVVDRQATNPAETGPSTKPRPVPPTPGQLVAIRRLHDALDLSAEPKLDVPKLPDPKDDGWRLVTKLTGMSLVPDRGRQSRPARAASDVLTEIEMSILKADANDKRPDASPELRDMPLTVRTYWIRQLLEMRHAVFHEKIANVYPYQISRTGHYLTRAWRFATWQIGLAEDDADVRQYWEIQQVLKPLQDYVADRLGRALQNPELLGDQVAEYVAERQERKARVRRYEFGLQSVPSTSTSSVAEMPDAPQADPSASRIDPKAPLPEDEGSADLKKLVDEYERRGASGLLSYDIAELNRLLLERRFPEVFRSRSEIRRLVTIWKDQEARWLWAMYGLIFFVISGFLVDLNTASLHRFYRNRLAASFLQSTRPEDMPTMLSEISTSRFGSPYHLISTTAGLSWVENPRENVWRMMSPDGEQAQSDDSTDLLRGLFVLSEKYCGSEITGYVRTDKYEKLFRGRSVLNLADAIALSGAAVSPQNVHSLSTAMLMFLLNMRLGQWVPNPKNNSPRCRPTAFAILADQLRKPQERKYCFLSDGGATENLGLVPLLRRRCRLIIAVDASADPEHHFEDFAKAIRTARVNDGITIDELCTTLPDFVAPDADEQYSMLLSGLRLPHSDRGEPLHRTCREHYAMFRIEYPSVAADKASGTEAGEPPGRKTDEAPRTETDQNSTAETGVTTGPETDKDARSEPLQDRASKPKKATRTGADKRPDAKAEGARDSGSNIDEDSSSDVGRGSTDEHHTAPVVRSRQPSVGLLIYVKPSLVGDESINLWQYRQSHPEFPHQATTDQVYSPDQAESYRELGEHIGDDLMRLVLPWDGRHDLWDLDLKDPVNQLVDRFESAYEDRKRRQSQAVAESDNRSSQNVGVSDLAGSLQPSGSNEPGEAKRGNDVGPGQDSPPRRRPKKPR